MAAYVSLGVRGRADFVSNPEGCLVISSRAVEVLNLGSFVSLIIRKFYVKEYENRYISVMNIIYIVSGLKIFYLKLKCIFKGNLGTRTCKLVQIQCRSKANDLCESV